MASAEEGLDPKINELRELLELRAKLTDLRDDLQSGDRLEELLSKIMSTLKVKEHDKTTK